ncbi:hypothetical protein Q5P01_023097 [Channa striata]|uniref:Uncharacterized protein n=1 Tax=Channa striata TaxID=64152 RepID=A0AA88J5V9_CHASR|nr:hypothetical protein Q5P01_023097 [Channa striata]
MTSTTTRRHQLRRDGREKNTGRNAKKKREEKSLSFGFSGSGLKVTGPVASGVMVDISVKSGAAWVCQAQGRHLVDVLLPVTISNKEDMSQLEGDKTKCCSPVLLEQTQEGSPCVLTLHCSSSSQCAISRLLVISEARTIEVYGQTEEYCGTVRGERDDSVQADSDDRGPFYRKQLTLENPSSACEVKLLSLAGRSSVLVSRVIVGLQPQQCCPDRGLGIDMKQVQCLVEELGTSLSPGAQNLMEMVHFQQKNQTSSLASQPQSADSKPLAETIRPADQTPPYQNGAESEGSSFCSSELPQSDVNATNTVNSESRGPVSRAQLAKMMSHFLTVQGQGPALSSDHELLPMLQSLCGQVTQLRLDDVAEAAEREKKMRNGTWELDAMERRLEEMERRLMEHVDRRLDALEQKLEKALLAALPLVALHQGAVSSPASSGPSEQTAQTSATH